MRRRALLRDREPAPEVAELDRRRLDVTIARLVEAEGIPAARLVRSAAKSDASGTETSGRVEFSVVAGAE